MVQISKKLLMQLLSLTRLDVSCTQEDVYYTLYDNESYSSRELTSKQGMELLQLKEDLKELEDERN